MKKDVLFGDIDSTFSVSYKELYPVVGAASKSAVRIGYVDLLGSKWVGKESPFSQVVEVDNVNENCQVDLKPDAEQLSVFREKDLAFVTENDGGVVTVYAIGQKPMNDYSIQVTITEVEE